MPSERRARDASCIVAAEIPSATRVVFEEPYPVESKYASTAGPASAGRPANPEIRPASLRLVRPSVPETASSAGSTTSVTTARENSEGVGRAGIVVIADGYRPNLT